MNILTNYLFQKFQIKQNKTARKISNNNNKNYLYLFLLN